MPPLTPAERLIEQRIRTESLHVKFDSQLADMRVSHAAKIPHVEVDLDEVTNFPDSIRWKLRESGLPASEIEAELASQQSYYAWKKRRLEEVVELLDHEIAFRRDGKVSRKPIGTEYFIDSDNGFNTNDGLNATATTHNITSSSVASPTNILCTGHGLQTNDNTTITGHSGSTPDINGDHVITRIDDDNFTIPVNVTTGGTGGTSTDDDGPFLDLHKFTETGRSAGDIATLRRGMTNRYDGGGHLDFTSDGTKDNPIVIRADNTNAFSDDVDLSVTATATLTFGSKTATFSADISGVLAAGDWIYVAAEDADEFAYEVDSVVTTTVTLFLPYKGTQAGSGKTMTNMQAPPVWNTTSVDARWNFNTDHCWKTQGIHIRGSNGAGNIGLDTTQFNVFKDCIFEGNGSGDYGIAVSDDGALFYVSKCRFFNHTANIRSVSGGGDLLAIVRDCLLDGNSVGSSKGIQPGKWGNVVFIDCEFKNHAAADVDASTSTSFSQHFLRNCILGSATEVEVNVSTTTGGGRVFSEDHDSALSVSAQYTGFSPGANTAIIDSETTTVRAGGGATSIKVTPSTHLSTNWELSRLLLFEYPIYATTDSKIYTVYFRPDATADWTADPTAAELWIELEYWGHASNNFRRITRSTEVIDMNGSTAWQTLTVTIAPSQVGVAYLRAYYAKTKESGKTNVFFCDTQVEIT